MHLKYPCNAFSAFSEFSAFSAFSASGTASERLDRSVCKHLIASKLRVNYSIAGSAEQAIPAAQAVQQPGAHAGKYSLRT